MRMRKRYRYFIGFVYNDQEGTCVITSKRKLMSQTQISALYDDIFAKLGATSGTTFVITNITLLK